jgi:hypothetical protein|tara:strand:- start:7537 stop:9099 length:1563 start_codon:yes stop_codon:yes gene_type:complete
MSASITDKVKRELLTELYDDFAGKIASGDVPSIPAIPHYIGVGRPEEWDSVTATPTTVAVGAANPPVPNSSFNEVLEFQSSLQSIKKVSDVSYVVPRYNWSSGSVYTSWDDNNSSDTTIGSSKDIVGPYYVITDQNNVFVCIQTGRTASGVVANSIYKPTNTGLIAFVTPDGYVWKFLFNVGVYNSRRYLTSNYIPVEYVPEVSSEIGYKSPENLSASRKQQYDVQIAAAVKRGEILSIVVESGGTGYTVPPVLTIRGSGTAALCFPLLDANGSIYQVIMKLNDAETDYSFGAGYDEKTWITSVRDAADSAAAVDAVLRPVICTKGIGADPRKDLNSSALMYSARLVGSESNFFPTTSDYRQVGLIKSPLVDDSAAAPQVAFTAFRGSAEKKLLVDKTTSGFDPTKIVASTIVTGATSGATAVVDFYDSDSSTQGTLRVHQTLSTGWYGFALGETLNFNTAAVGTAVCRAGVIVDGVLPPVGLQYADVDNYSGDVMYIDNRVAMIRDSDQTEDIKIIIDL